MIIGFTGKKRHGKSTAAGVLVREYGFTEINFADSLREIMAVLNPIVGCWGYRELTDKGDHDYEEPIRYNEAIERYGYERAKEEYPEIVRLLQIMGTDVGRKMILSTLWTDLWEKKVRKLGGRIVVSDVRFVEEAEAVNNFNGFLFKVIRPGYIHDVEADKHASEQGFDWDFDATITSQTPESLENNIRIVMDEYFHIAKERHAEVQNQV